MLSNLDRYKEDLESLIQRGNELFMALQHECFPEEFEQNLRKELGRKSAEVLKALPSFREAYQPWYSEAKALIRQFLPDRLQDFVRHYEKPKSRKVITCENYRIDDCLQGVMVTRVFETQRVAGPDAALPHLRQQVAIVKSVRARFKSSLFDIRQLVQADLFDSELESATELAAHGYFRAAGAVAGVVLERHLQQVCGSHDIGVGKKAPGIADLNNALKDGGVVDVPQWRFVQHLADIRNLCDHEKKVDPTADQVSDLITGVAKITKTVY